MGSPVLVQAPTGTNKDRTSGALISSLGRFYRGEAFLLRPRKATRSLTGLAATDPVEGPFLRFYPIRDRRDIGVAASMGLTSAQPGCQDAIAKVAQPNDTFECGGFASQAVSENFASPYELDAFSNVPFVCPFDGTAELVVSQPTAAAFDFYKLPPGDYSGRVDKYKQTRDCPINQTTDVFVPLGCYGFEIIHAATGANAPTVSLFFEDTGKAGPPATLITLASLDPAANFYRYGQVMSVANARAVRVVNPAGGGNVKLVFHIVVL